MSFTHAESTACDRLIELALEEDLAAAGDITSQATIPSDSRGRTYFVARDRGIIAGLVAVEKVFAVLDNQLDWCELDFEGSPMDAGMILATVEGPLRSILAGERVALNFLQRLSGIATLTKRYVDAVAGLPVKILDTRKTTPGWRLLEKYAVRCGGGHNHRMGLYDGILIKDNHLAALRGGPDAITRAIELARNHTKPGVPIEVEVDTLDQLDRALACQSDIVLLDNMSLDQMREAVLRRNAVAPGVLLEASGGVNLQTVRAIAETGVDRVSVGALTHSAPALDIALDYLPP